MTITFGIIGVSVFQNILFINHVYQRESHKYNSYTLHLYCRTFKTQGLQALKRILAKF